MDEGPQFRALFHEELAALDHTIESGVRRGELAAGTDDPDVRRLIEAMAFFSARTRASASAAMRAAIIRLAGGLLDNLFAPMPAAALLQADGWGLLDAPIELPEGTQMRVETYDGRASIFSTRGPLPVRPIRIQKAEIARSARGAELRIHLAARVPQKGQIELPFFVRRHGDYNAGAELHEELRRHFLRAVATKDNGIDRACDVSFEPPAPARPWDTGESGSPIDRIRSFFHAPEQALLFRVSVPAEGPAPERLTLTISLGASFPEQLSVTADTFALFVVPMQNAWSDLAEPISVDGTSDARQVRLLHSALEGVEPVTVRGIYRPVQKVLTPVPPRSLSGEEGDSYEVLFPEDGSVMVRVSSPDAVAAPWIAQVDAVWSQPSLWQNARGPLTVRPQRKKALDGLSLRVLGNVRPPLPSPLALSPEKGLDVLALKQKPTLEARDLRALLTLFGASGASPYARFPGRIAGLTASFAPDPIGARGPRKRVYRVEMQRPAAGEEALAPWFHRQVSALLDAWSPEPADVETTSPRAGDQEISP
ncbi:type VI secretion system baseplate subunit TssF [Sorangium sp. So ce1000]|uniref:type VI secretion system baseplate subunit TssF n=1 Tax=Sorangium sp. So ce1000 TaxID=3133325 RepID=UPI003F5EDA1A